MTYVRAVDEQGAHQPEPETRFDAAPGAPDDASGAGPGPTDIAADESSRSHAFLLYNLARLALLVLAFAAFYLVGFRGLALIVVALLVSGAVSYFALYRLRGAAAVSFAGGWRRWNDRLEERTRAEDLD